MHKYETLIFDLDDTLIDNNSSINYAFKMMINELNIAYSDSLYSKWKEFDNAYWHTWESGKMVIPDYINSLDDKIKYIRANRFILFFDYLNIDFNLAVHLNDIYCSMLGVNIVEIENANKLLNEVYSYYEIVVATNGPKDAAIQKLKKANLINYISSIICSEEIGYSKPMKEYFDYLFNVVNNKNKSKMLLIGDSLTTDILGGINNGIDTCWFNPNNKTCDYQYEPTISINKLLDLKKYL
jgi:FMN phosphatase YigB (HAD superfamily)